MDYGVKGKDIKAIRMKIFTKNVKILIIFAAHSNSHKAKEHLTPPLNGVDRVDRVGFEAVYKPALGEGGSKVTKDA